METKAPLKWTIWVKVKAVANTTKYARKSKQEMVASVIMINNFVHLGPLF